MALTEKWAEMYKNKGIGFYSMHPGWAETPGVARSLPGFNKSLVIFSFKQQLKRVLTKLYGWLCAIYDNDFFFL